MNEEWRDIPGYNGTYQVSNLGRVRRPVSGPGAGASVLGDRQQNGYPVVRLRRDGTTALRYVHRLVAEAFIGECPPGHIVHHLDGDRANPRADNLIYTTDSDHRHRHHTMDCARPVDGAPGHGISLFDTPRSAWDDPRRGETRQGGPAEFSRGFAHRMAPPHLEPYAPGQGRIARRPFQEEP